MQMEATECPFEGVYSQLHYRLEGRSLFTGLDYWTGLLDWTTGLTFDLKCSIYMKKFMFYLCEKNYIDRAHGFFAQSTV